MSRKRKTPSEQKPTFPWKEVLTVIGTLAAAYLTYRGVVYATDRPIQATQTAQAEQAKTEAAATARIPPVTTGDPAPSATQSPVSTNTPSNSLWNGLLSVRKPTTQEISSGIFSDIWRANSIEVKDLARPSSADYTGQVVGTKEYLFSTYWCATSTNFLVRNLASMSFHFLVDGQSIPNDFVQSYDYEPSKNWRCTIRAVVLGGWAEKQRYALQVKRTLLTSISDGKSQYPEGDYFYNLNVDVR